MLTQWRRELVPASESHGSPDSPLGTTTAWNKDKTKVLHSHGPPVRPG
jgi:hypothetical protein